MVVASLPASALLVADAVYRYGQEKANALLDLRKLAANAAASDGSLLNETQEFLRSLAASPEVLSMREDPLGCRELLAASLSSAPQHAFLGAANVSGELVCPGLPLATPINVRGGVWFQRVMVQKDFVVGNYAVDRASGQPALHAAYPIFTPSGEMIGAVHGALHALWVKQQLAQLQLPEGYAVALLNPSGEVIVKHPDTRNPFGGSLPQNATDPSSGPATLTPPEGGRWLVAAAPLGGIPWKGITVLVGAEESILWGAVWRHVGLGVGLYLAVLVLGVSAAIFGAYRLVVLPVRRLHGATEALAAGHPLPAPPSDGDRSELAHLARAFSRMASTLEAQRATLRNASAQKSRFLAVASHDLRQPLHAAMLSLEFASRGASPEVLTYIERARKSIRRLSQQLDMLADIVQRDALGSGLGPRMWRVPLGNVLQRLAESHGPSAREKGLRLRVVMSRLVVATDAVFLGSILDNLVDNAIKYTDRGRVLIGCRRTSTTCRIEVHDTGRGIPADQLEQVFNAFYRGDASAGEGLGLGLLIARETAVALGHRLSVRSTLGAGSCFTVELPLWSAWVQSQAAPGETAQ